MHVGEKSGRAAWTAPNIAERFGVPIVISGFEPVDFSRVGIELQETELPVRSELHGGLRRVMQPSGEQLPRICSRPLAVMHELGLARRIIQVCDEAPGGGVG